MRILLKVLSLIVLVLLTGWGAVATGAGFFYGNAVLTDLGMLAIVTGCIAFWVNRQWLLTWRNA